MVGTMPNLPPDTSMNPATPGSGWTQGDPGWANAARTGSFLNAVYLGDGWVLSAAHTGVTAVQLVDAGPWYAPIPNQTYYFTNLSGRAATVPGLTNPTPDLALYRVNGDPGLPSLTIASQPLAVNDTVMFIANGLYRASAESHWTVNTATDPDTWTEVGSCSGTNCYHGYKPGGGGKRWGINTIEDDADLFGSMENDSNITINVNNATIANMTQFNQSGGNAFEAQVVGGDSGSGVYHNRNGVWELAGISINTYTPNGQSSINAVYGNASAMVDLYSYADQIAAIQAAHADYSVVGDLNLDGLVNENDIAIFVANWQVYDDPAGSITSWKHGDLTHDGKVDISDFFKWRDGAAGSASALGSLLGIVSGGTGVPEPTTGLLGLIALMFFSATKRSRFRR